MATRKSETNDIAKVLAELSAQVAALSERLGKIEAAAAPTQDPVAPSPSAPASGLRSGEAEHEGVSAPAAASTAEPAPAAAEPPEIPEEEILAISAALGAFFGVRMRIRQIRLLSSQAWAQQGRVSIQASHRLHN